MLITIEVGPGSSEAVGLESRPHGEECDARIRRTEAESFRCHCGKVLSSSKDSQRRSPESHQDPRVSVWVREEDTEEGRENNSAIGVNGGKGESGTQSGRRRSEPVANRSQDRSSCDHNRGMSQYVQSVRAEQGKDERSKRVRKG